MSTRQCFIIIGVAAFSFSVCSKEAKKTAVVKKEVVKTLSPEVPCDSKEDILKKLEEKKKLEAEKNRGFSLQGGNTGCSVK